MVSRLLEPMPETPAVTTTPILHYLVRAINTKGTEDAYGVDSEEGYFTKLSTAFKKLIVSLSLKVISASMTSLFRLADRHHHLCSLIVLMVLVLLLPRNYLNT